MAVTIIKKKKLTQIRTKWELINFMDWVSTFEFLQEGNHLFWYNIINILDLNSLTSMLSSRAPSDLNPVRTLLAQFK